MSDSDSDHSDKEASDHEEGHDLVANVHSDEADSDAEEAAAPAAVEPPASKLEAPATLFLPYNKGYYKVPKLDKDRGQMQGWLRCYMRSVPISSGKLLGEMCAKEATAHKAWPKKDELKKMISADKIVVLNGKFVESKKGSTETKTIEDCNVWYVLFEVDGASGKQDEKILRHIPKSVYKELIEGIKKDAGMAQSSLLRMYAYNDNEKSLNPEDNGMVKALDAEKPKTALIAPKKEDKPGKAKEADKEEKAADKPEEGKKGKSSKKSAGNSADKPEESDAEKKKPAASMESFWKPRPTAEAGDEEPKEPKEPKKSKSSKDAPREEGGTTEPSVGTKRAEAPAANGNGTALFKRRRTSVVEEHDFVICEAGVKVEFPAPEGATGGKAVITWAFD